MWGNYYFFESCINRKTLYYTLWEIRNCHCHSNWDLHWSWLLQIGRSNILSSLSSLSYYWCIIFLNFSILINIHDHLQRRIAKQMFAFRSWSDDEGKRDVAIIEVREDVNQNRIVRIRLNLPWLGWISFSFQWISSSCLFANKTCQNRTKLLRIWMGRNW